MTIAVSNSINYVVIKINFIIYVAIKINSAGIKINYVATNSFVWIQKEYTASVESFVKNEIIFINFKSIKTF